MICLAFECPEHLHRGPVVLVLVLERENLERMKQGDPFDIHLRTIARPGGMNPNALARDLDVVIAYEEDLDFLMEFQRKQDLPAMLAYLERGRSIEPGDLAPITTLRRT